ncbi:MAG TPA: VWA domain-containing protein [Pyrinomonadaceae bacterium]|jgi:VWFA-related protein|nr:VWA domain-containing protein [Pyrinomonadaceae bacterium]
MKKSTSLFIIILIVSLLAPVLAQTTTAPLPAPSITAQQQPTQTQSTTAEDDEVVRITSNLVQVDAVITDQKGNHVTDLRQEDFEIYEDGRPQKITNFSYVSMETRAKATSTTTAAAPRDKNAPPVPPTRLRPEQVRRTIALVVDDLGLSFESAHYVRRTLKKFVDEQMQPSDLVAIIRTGGGMGALQQFTSDKRQLYSAIERVRWNPQGRASISAFPPLGRELDDPNQDSESEQTGRTARDLSNDTDQFRSELFTVGTLGALNYIIQGLKDLPGRKSVLLVTDGFTIFNTPDSLTSGGGSSAGTVSSDRVLEAMRRLIDLANRASVVIYTMDPRGLPTLGFTAEDNLSGMRPDQIQGALSKRSSDYIASQDGPNLLARETGGFSIRNTNDLSAGMRQVLDDQKGYYLIGYRPEESTFDPKTGSRRFHDIKIKVKRPDLRVRSRNGFYGVVNEVARAVPRTRVAQLNAALTSPFNSNGIRLRLTSLFGNDPQTGSFIRSLLHIEGRDITFTKDTDGWMKAVLDVLVITFGDNGTVVDQLTNTYTVRVRGKTYERALQTGFTYTLNLPIKKGGAYQLRAALRDSSSERVGSASQFIEVPEMNLNRLALSGIVISGSDPSAASNTAAGKPSTSAAATGTDSALSAPPPQMPEAQQEGTDSSERTDPQATPSVRRFKNGMVLQYDYVVFNAKVDKAAPRRTQLHTQVRLFRDGQPFYTGNPKPLDTTNQTDLKRLITGGALRLGTDMTPGEYVLQVVVTDMLAEDKYRTATQWIDFDIVK